MSAFAQRRLDYEGAEGPAARQILSFEQAAGDSRARLHRQNSGAAYPSRSGLKKAGFPTEIYERFGSMQRAFLALDTDRSGRISVNELRAMARKWNLPAARQFFAEHYFRSNALHCTATARILIPAECSAVS